MSKHGTSLQASELPLTPLQGLSEAEARERRENGQSNKASQDAGKTPLQIVSGHVLTLFNLLNVLLAIALAAVGSYRNMLFMGVVILNTCIGIVQELRARRTIRRLRLLSAPAVAVIRDGKERTVSPEELVLGDLIVLRAGDQVVADGILREGTGAVNESLLTGESDDVPKHTGDELLSGSYLTEGKITLQLTRVGDQSYANQLTAEARRTKAPQSALLRDVRKLIRFDSLLLVPLGLLLFLKLYLLRHLSLAHAVSSAAAAMIGMIPEGLVLLTSIALTVGVLRLGKRQTLVQSLYGIETLARADTLCLDKTGTLTTGDMEVAEVLPLQADETALREALALFLGAFECRSATLAALAAWAPPRAEIPDRSLPFSSSRKLSAAAFGERTLLLGAPTFVCSSQPQQTIAWQQQAAAKGLRILMLAESHESWAEGFPSKSRRILGYIALRDRLRPGAAETLRHFAEQKVALKLISGDDPMTVSAVAKQLDFPQADRWIDVSTLEDQELTEAAQTYAIFGRVTPERKRQLVRALQASGHSVAMTGDGVNDIPALRAADCSIAMAGGSDAARHAAQINLLSGDFTAMPAVVDEGRRAVNNVTRAATLFLMKTLYSFGLSLLILLLPIHYPFQPIQMSLISACTIGIPSFFLALEPNRDPIQGSFLRTVLTRALPGAIAVLCCTISAMLLTHLGWPYEVCSTLATLSAGAVGWMELWLVSRPFTSLRRWVLLSMGLLMILLVCFAGSVFYLIPLQGMQLLVLIMLVVLAALILFAAKTLMTHSKLFQRSSI